MKTSGLYNDNLSVDSAVTLAAEKAGIEPPMMDYQFVNTCFRILNKLFDGWSNDGVNLWTRQRFMQNLNYGQASYQLPTSVMNLMELTVASTTRVFGTTGVPFSLNGNAALAFDGDPTTYCVCTATGSPPNITNAYIGWNYNATFAQSIKYIGIQSHTTSTYTISVQYSFDNTTWYDAVTDNVTYCPAGQIIWICSPCPIAAQYWRITETTGQTLSIEELYFNIDNISKLMGSVSNGDYEAYSNKGLISTPSSYTLYRFIQPNVALYPVPDLSTYQYLIYTAQVYIQQINSLYQLFYLPQRYNAAIIDNLAFGIAEIMNPQRAQMLKLQADMSYMAAAKEDSEKQPLEFYFEWAR